MSVADTTRLASYPRDGCSCLYCGESIEDGAKETNLVTCCHLCNSRRGKRSWKAFEAKVAACKNHGLTAAGILSNIKAATGRTLASNAANELIARRGGRRSRTRRPE